MGCRHNPTVFDGNEASFVESIAPEEANAEDDVFSIEAFCPGAFAPWLYVSSNHEGNGQVTATQCTAGFVSITEKPPAEESLFHPAERGVEKIEFTGNLRGAPELLRRSAAEPLHGLARYAVHYFGRPSLFQ
jgi:hypothetical protein